MTQPPSPTPRTNPPAAGRRTGRTFFGQPWPLVNLFGVELWERFSFYGMQGNLLIYLYYTADQGGLGIDQATAAGIVGAYGGSVYLSTILGGWLADRLLGRERTLFLSAAVVMAGHLALAFLPGTIGVTVGLLAIALGSGGVKANATSLVGALYEEKDPRRDAGFSIFYMGINIGALLGPIITGFLQVREGFHWAFGAAAVGMAIGLVQYAVSRRNLPAHTATVADPLPADRRPRVVLVAVVAVVAVAVLVFTGVIRADTLNPVVIIGVVLATVAYFTVILRSPKVDAVERRRVLAFIPMFVASVAFWSLFQQQSTLVTIYADQRLNRDLFGWQFPVAWVQSIQPFWVILLAGVFAAVWTRLGDRQPSTPVKFAFGAGAMGVAFLLFVPMAGGGPNSAPLLGLIGILLVFTLAELLLSPVGLSLATKLAPQAFQTQMVALFFLSVSLGSAISGLLAGLYSPEHEVLYFSSLGLGAIVIGAVLVVIAPRVTRLMGGVR